MQNLFLFPPPSMICPSSWAPKDWSHKERMKSYSVLYPQLFAGTNIKHAMSGYSENEEARSPIRQAGQLYINQSCLKGIWECLRKKCIKTQILTLIQHGCPFLVCTWPLLNPPWACLPNDGLESSSDAWSESYVPMSKRSSWVIRHPDTAEPVLSGMNSSLWASVFLSQESHSSVVIAAISCG